MPHDRPTITTHVLDTAAGQPVAGIRVRCCRLEGTEVTVVGQGITDDDGRIRDLLEGHELAVGHYRLVFELGPSRYFEAATLDIRIDDAGRSHHVPLLLSPYGLTTYRGS